VEEDKPSSVYTNVVDIWSFGCVVYKVAAKHVPFPSGREIKRFCDKRIPFPAQSLEGKLTTSGIDFLKSILVARPLDRPTADVALKHPWLLFQVEDVDSSEQQRSKLVNGKEISALSEAKMEDNTEVRLTILCIENLSHAATEEDLAIFFRRYVVGSISVIRDSPSTGCYALVRISTSEAERAIVQLSGKEILGRRVGVRYFFPLAFRDEGSAKGNPRSDTREALRQPPQKGEKDPVMERETERSAARNIE
jgi:serine/threonine protein kinase